MWIIKLLTDEVFEKWISRKVSLNLMNLPSSELLNIMKLNPEKKKNTAEKEIFEVEVFLFVNC